MIVKWGCSPVAEPDLSEAQRELDRLVERIHQELSAYEGMAKACNDNGRLQYVNWTRKWLSTDGAEIVKRLRAIIDRLAASRLDEIRGSIRASERLANLARERDLTELSNWDLVWEWTLDILPTLERACQRLDHETGEGILRLRVSMPEPFKVRLNTDISWSSKRIVVPALKPEIRYAAA